MQPTLLSRLAGAFQSDAQKEKNDDLSFYLSGQSVTQLFPIHHYDPVAELIYLNDRVGFSLELSPLCGMDETALDLLKAFLTDVLPIDAIMQINLWASPKIDSFLDEWKNFRAARGEMFEQLAKWRVDYLRQGNKQPLIADEPHVLRNFRLLVSCSLPLSSPGAEQVLTNLRTRLEATFKNMQFFVSKLPINHYLTLLDELMDPYQEANDIDWQKELPLNAHLTNPEYQLVTYPDKLVVNDAIEISAYTIRQFPKQWAGMGMGELIGSFLRSRMQLAFPFMINLILQKDAKEQSERRCMMKSLRADRMLSSGITRFFPKMRGVAEDWQLAKGLIDEGERFVKVNYQVITYAPVDKSQQCESALRDLYTANGWKLYRDSHVCLNAWLSSLPLVPHGTYTKALKKLQRFKTVMTNQAVHLFPLQGEYKGGRSPCLLLAGRRGQPLWFDPFDNTQGNYNTTVVGKSGSGKSVLMQDLMVGLAGSGARVFVIDVGRSFQHVCEYVGGEFMAFQYDKPICLNPFSQIKDIRESLELLKPLLGLMISQNRVLSDYENAILEKAILAVWADKNTKTCITDIANFLLKSSDGRSQDLGTMLFPYTAKGMYGDFFEGPCSLDFKSPVTVLELEELKSRKDLQSVVLMLLMYHITEAMYLGSREERIACIIDEAWDLFSGQLSGKFIETGSRRARKYNGAFISGTQSLNDYLNNPAALAAYENADNRIFLSHNTSALEAVNSSYDDKLFTPYEMSLLKTLKTEKGKYSELFIKTPAGFFVARYYLDPLTQLLYSTTADVHSRIQSLLSQGLSIQDAVETIYHQQGRRA